jgi:hypothetical protein
MLERSIQGVVRWSKLERRGERLPKSVVSDSFTSIHHLYTDLKYLDY